MSDEAADEPASFIADGRRVVFIGEESCARLADLVEFVRQHEAEFFQWRQQWGERQFITRVQQ